ncbi:hypothetical protein ABZ883_40535 [Streptomyces sp. NPDC046977]|uniref:putative phage holin n=1 Tax=Streptomyces sp. NPDC046977 TaxID=3154703 RepID=UPI0033EC6426
MNDPARLTNLIGSGLVALACARFVIIYHLRAPWRRTATGRHIMGLVAVIGVLGLYTILITVWPEGLFADILRAVRSTILVVMAAVILGFTRMVTHAQRQDHDRPPE